jgi:transposase InsO family protein
MVSVLRSLVLTLRTLARSRAALQLENLALRHQLEVLQRTRPRRIQLAKTDRWLWVLLSRLWTGWRTALVIAWRTPEAWDRRVSSDRREIHGPGRQPPSQTWRTFLSNHVGQIVAADFFVVPTVTFRLMFVLVLLGHDRRRIRHVAVTAHPTAAWTAQQVREAFPWDEAPRYLLHDRDHTFDALGATAKAMGIEDVVTAPHAPWQNPFVERFVGSARRECFDHVIAFNEGGVQKLMTRYGSYYEKARTHLALDKDAPIPRPVMPPGEGDIVEIPEVGGLHHRYERRAA